MTALVGRRAAEDLSEQMRSLARQVESMHEAVGQIMARCQDRGMPQFLANETGPQARLALLFLAEELHLESRSVLEDER